MQIRDGGWLLIDHDPATGRTVWSHDNGDGTTTLRTDYPVQATVDANTAQRNMAASGWAGDYHHVASIPLNVYWDQLAEADSGGDDRYVSRWLNDGDNRAWRTKDGKV